MISYQSKTSPKLKTEFLKFLEAVSSIILIVDSVRPYKLARPFVTWRRGLNNIKDDLLGQVKLSQIHPIAVYGILEDINSSGFSIVHKSELRFINISGRIPIKKHFFN